MKGPVTKETPRLHCAENNYLCGLPHDQPAQPDSTQESRTSRACEASLTQSCHHCNDGARNTQAANHRLLKKAISWFRDIKLFRKNIGMKFTGMLNNHLI